MTRVTRLVLDVLKPHKPTVLEYGQVIAALGKGFRVSIDVRGVDEATEDVVINIEAEHIDFEAVDAAITSLGGSVHSTDRVEVVGDEGTAPRPD